MGALLREPHQAVPDGASGTWDWDQHWEPCCVLEVRNCWVRLLLVALGTSAVGTSLCGVGVPTVSLSTSHPKGPKPLCESPVRSHLGIFLPQPWFLSCLTLTARDSCSAVPCPSFPYPTGDSRIAPGNRSPVDSCSLRRFPAFITQQRARVMNYLK